MDGSTVARFHGLALIIHGSRDRAGSLLVDESVNCFIGYPEEMSYTSGQKLCSRTLAPAYCDTI